MGAAEFAERNCGRASPACPLDHLLELTTSRRRLPPSHARVRSVHTSSRSGAGTRPRHPTASATAVVSEPRGRCGEVAGAARPPGTVDHVHDTGRVGFSLIAATRSMRARPAGPACRSAAAAFQERARHPDCRRHCEQRGVNNLAVASSASISRASVRADVARELG